MKWLSILFSLYIVISGISCTNFDRCSEDAVAHEIHADTASPHTEEDACSPFCTCLCCTYTVFAGVVFTGSPAIAVTISSPAVSSYSSPHSPGFYAKIWQPPKIA